MNKKSMFVIGFLMFLYIVPLILMPSSMHTSYATEQNTSKDFSLSYNSFWYNDAWLYRKMIPIIEQPGAGTNYQLNITGYYDDNTKDVAGSIDFEGLCQTDFDDVLFTSSNGVTLLDFWLNPDTYVASTSAIFWVKIPANITLSDVLIFCYFGNPSAVSLSDPDNTFLFFDDFENNNLARWDTVGTDWSTQSSVKFSGTYAAYGNSASSRFLMHNVALTSGGYLIHANFRVVEIGNYYKYGIHMEDSDTHDVSGVIAYSNDWKWYNGSAQAWQDNTVAANTWYTLDLAFILGGNIYLWINDAYIGSHSFVCYSDTVVTNLIALGSGTSGNSGKDQYIDNFIFREWTIVEPSFDAPEVLEENTLSYSWENIDSFTLYFETPSWMPINLLTLIFVTPLYTTALDWFLIIFGLCLIPASTMFLVYGGRKNFSADKLFIFLMIFFIGWGLLLGGIF